MPTLANRNNNPGNLRDPNTGTFRTFSTPREGYAALLNDLQAKKTGTTSHGIGPDSTLADFANVYAPADDNNDPHQYTVNLANHMKVRPDSKISELDVGKWADAIAHSEGYQSQPGGFVNPEGIPTTQHQAGNGFVQVPEIPGTAAPELQEPQGSRLQRFGRGAYDFVKDIEKPFIGVAAMPVQALAKATGVEDPYSDFAQKTGMKDVTPLQFKEKAGDIAQVGSYFVPGGGLGGAVTAGVLQGAGQSASKGESGVEIAGKGALGGALGGLVYGGTKLIGKGIEKLGEVASGAQHQKAIAGIKDAYSRALNLHQADRAFETRTGKDLADVLVKHSAPLGRYENGTLDASKAIDVLKEALAPLESQADDILSHPQGVVHNVNLSEVLDSVVKRIDDMSLPALQSEAAKEQAQKFLEAEARKYGTELTPAIANKIKQGFWAASFDKTVSNLQRHVPYLIGNETKKAIEKSIGKTDTEVVLGPLNGEIGDLVDAIRRLSKLDNVRLVRGGRFGNMLGGLEGLIGGGLSGAGVPGMIAGHYFGKQASQMLQNPQTQITIANQFADKSGLLPRMLGRASKPIGAGLVKLGEGIARGARGAGLLGNMLVRQ